MRYQRQWGRHTLPPDAQGRRRRLMTDHGRSYPVVELPFGHPLVGRCRWVSQARVVAFEAGLDFLPGDRVVCKNGDPLDVRPENLVIWPRGTRHPRRPPRLCRCGCGRAIKHGQKYFERACWVIQDEFSDLPVSRQRIAQLRWKKAGRCIICGKRPLVTPNHCARCRGKILKHTKARYRRDPQFRAMIKEGGLRWRAQHPDYTRFYHRLYQPLRLQYGPKAGWPVEVAQAFHQAITQWKEEKSAVGAGVASVLNTILSVLEP